MARVFAYLMSDAEVDLSDKGIFSDTSDVIRQAMKNIYQSGRDNQHITKRGFEIALKKLI
jgi:Arc/MetJ-type ribon-helix-helix transcriptional regulator